MLLKSLNIIIHYEITFYCYICNKIDALLTQMSITKTINLLICLHSQLLYESEYIG